MGVLTFHRSINYGSYWQAHCLVEGLRRRGYHVELLDHDCPKVLRAELQCALQPELPRRTPRRFLGSYATKVRNVLDAVGGLPLSRRFPLNRPQVLQSYDAIVVGSDEVWNFRHPWFGSQPIFFGERLKTRRLISYAASFGNHSAWDGIHPAWARKLDRFAGLSVRDENSFHLVRNGTGRTPSIVLDPCLYYPNPALAAADASTGRYAVVYGHGFPDWLKRRMRRWAEARRLRLISVGYLNDWADEQLIEAGPLDFARIMAGGAAVVTNFFHGCVFALLYGKPWISFPSAYRSIKIPDLVALVGAQDRVIDEDTPFAAMSDQLETPVRASVSAKIAQLRRQSDAYLDAALS